MEPSTYSDKKFMTITPSGKIVHFGASGYQDYTEHHDEKRRLSYCKRAQMIRNKEGLLTAYDPESANYYATRLLWSCHLFKWWKKPK